MKDTTYAILKEISFRDLIVQAENTWKFKNLTNKKIIELLSDEVKTVVGTILNNENGKISIKENVSAYKENDTLYLNFFKGKIQYIFKNFLDQTNKNKVKY
ncbi:MAG: hypothetical protein PHV68_09995 [Candidatus Gastranaerophilales bacterium]|jgi:hypothetical protein|nr:hypothetical protein [Candidatus Gastranaerophilales bacterium]